MAGFYNLYLPTILLMRSGDIETNPGPNTPESTVSELSEEDFLLLSEQIHSSDYKRVGLRLGISYTVLSGIKKRSDDDSDAFMQLFMRWRKKQPPGTNIKAILAEELQTCGLVEMSGSLLDGSLLSNKTSKPPVLPTSQTHQSLSPELIQKCTEDFKFKYRNTLCKIRADPLNPDSLVPFQDMYTNLVLEEEHGINKRLLEYSDLVNLKDNKGKFSRRLLVQGEAGAGKTTLCAKIAWDWINEYDFQEFEWVIIVPLREAKKYTIGEIAKSYLTSNNPTTASQLTEYMHLNTDKVFIVFDGLDEFDGDGAGLEEDGSQTTSHKSNSLQSSQAQGQSSHSSGSTQHQAKIQSASGQKKVSSAENEIGVEEILRSEKLETVPVMVTTRPWKAKEIRSNDRLRKLYTFLYVEGFSKQNVATYIKKYFADDKDKAKAESLIQFANDNDVISENMAPYPIYIAMLCLMWREFDEEKQEIVKSLQTFSQIFMEIFVFLKEHYALKMSNRSCSLDKSLNDCLKDVNKLLEPIASLALNGLLKHTLVFREGDFKHCQDSMETACRVGVLSEESKIILRKGRHDASNPRMQSTVFFPHKLFQEYMAGVHLAFLYKTDNREYNRLMEQVVCPRKEEFRYLLYFTACQNQMVGISVLTHIERSTYREDDKRFLVDVAFECHDTRAAAVIKDKVLPKNATLDVHRDMTAHTVAGYAFIKSDMVSLRVERKCGPTVSYEVAEIICSVPSLREVTLVLGDLHNNFYTTLASQGQFLKVQSLTIRFDGNTVSEPDSHDLAVALCTMPNLTQLTLDRVNHLPNELYSTWKSMASFMKVQSLTIRFDGNPVSEPASHDLAVSLCTIPNLTELTLDRVLCLRDEFFSTWKSMASFMKIQSLTIRFGGYPVSEPASRDLAVALCTTPNLTELTLDAVPCLHDEFFPTWKSMASSMKIQSLTIRFGGYAFSEPASRDLAVALCTTPNLTELTLNEVPCRHDEFFSTWKSMASSMKVQSLTIGFDLNPVSYAASHDLALALCTIPNMTELTLKDGVHNLQDKFFSTWKSMASMKDCFPQITQGNFFFNGTHQESLESFMCERSNRQREQLSSSEEVVEEDFEGLLHAFPQSSPVNPQQAISDHQGWYTAAASAVDSYDVHHSAPEGLTSTLLHPRDTDVSEPTRTEGFSYIQEAGNLQGRSDDRRYTGDASLVPSQSQESFQPPLYPDQVGDRPESARRTPSMLSSPFQVPQATGQHSHTRPLPHQGPDPTTNVPTSAHQLSQSVDNSDNVLQSLQTVGSSSGRSQSLKRTAPYTQSRVPQDVPEKQPRLDILEESPSVRLCEYSSSDESSTS